MKSLEFVTAAFLALSTLPRLAQAEDDVVGNHAADNASSPEDPTSRKAKIKSYLAMVEERKSALEKLELSKIKASGKTDELKKTIQAAYRDSQHVKEVEFDATSFSLSPEDAAKSYGQIFDDSKALFSELTLSKASTPLKPETLDQVITASLQLERLNKEIKAEREKKTELNPDLVKAQGRIRAIVQSARKHLFPPAVASKLSDLEAQEQGDPLQRSVSLF